jgi:hypothetical protein
MADDFLISLIGNAARARVLRVFVFSQNEALLLPLIAKRTGASPRVALKEIKFLEKLGIVKKGKFSITLGNGSRKIIVDKGKQKEDAWVLNQEFKHVAALSKFVHEVSPLHYESILEALKHSGKIATIVLSGTFMGDPSRPADLLVAADGLNEQRLEAAVKGLEPRFGREIRYAAFSTPEFRYRLTIQDRLIRDTLDYPHLVLLDKTRLL